MRRFLTLADVEEILQINSSQAYALVRSGQLKAIRVGGRGVWRIEAEKLEEYIQEQYEQTRLSIENPSSTSESSPAN
ncbi:helix-turn-helix domain-containing protein [Arthrobacter woluwensis]|uniref:DNA binding domain-containing protein, excisionase family n=1 Tax=Arthrobacter woluwensis TaxID=156980 RepID=A0A1H4MX16_9MICC|nr:helix-turn-helix domain-containing protein [Arthrobacter woluwensis]SEB86912.1 DNA binding domain-containing protein, excisionase family [Arthrobacter woluwensis]